VKYSHWVGERSLAPNGHARPEDAIALAEGRFEIVRELGVGGMGTVYEAFDRETEQTVALKTFRRMSSDAVFRVKQEFRGLADLEHPNLVRLHELFVEGNEVYFSMELVRGRDFLEYVTEAMPAPPGPDEQDHGLATLRAGQRPLACDEDRLRGALPQLAAGIAAIHAAGKLHRDIKPSNVLVTDDGLVKILDFGLVIDIDGQTSDSMIGRAVGTPFYMSPEQAAGDPTLGPTSDWYAFGTILYQALTGTLPFFGPPLQVMLDKTRLTPAPPRQLVPDVPRDLDGLAESLLVPSPESRLRGQAVLTQLGVTVHAPILASGTTHTGSQLAPYRGRTDELDQLRDRFERVRDLHQPALTVVAGESGIGKSAFIAEFLDRLRANHPDLIVLRGRCYESETVPHNALDPIIDQLSRHWRRLDKERAGYLLPREPHLLPLLFPVLGRVPAVARQRRLRVPEDAQQRRDAAYAALRETLARLSSQNPLVIVIDDMQWSDDDSLLLLSDLLHPTEGIPALILFGTRPAGLHEDTQLTATLDRAGSVAQVLPLGPLSTEDCALLARHQLGPDAADELVDAVVKEANGNPFFVTELTRHVAHVGRDALADRFPRVEDLIEARVRALPDDARALLEVLAVAAEPLSRDVASVAAEIEGERFATAVRTLRGAALARSGGTSTETLECYHDRIRRAVANTMEPARRIDYHRVLANTLRALEPANDERIANHYRGCGEDALAAEHFEGAAKRSLGELEFARASSQLALAIDLGDLAGRRRFDLLLELGDTLGKAGRHREAAKRFEQAIDLTEHEHEVIDLRRRIASSWLALGDTEAGLQAAAQASRAAGMDMPKRRRALAELLWMKIRFRAGLRLARRHKPRRLMDPSERARAETCLSLSQGLTWLDAIGSAAFAARLFKRAGDLGAPDLLAHALGHFAIGTAFFGHPRPLEDSIARLSKQDGAPREVAAIARLHISYARSVHHQLEHLDGAAALKFLDEAVNAKNEAGLGDSPGTEALLFWRMAIHSFSGKWRAFDEFVSTLLTAAGRSGHRFVEVAARSLGAVRHLANDAPQQAREDLRRALDLWPSRDVLYSTLHSTVDLSSVWTERYAGDFDEAWRVQERATRDTARSGLFSIPNVRYATLARHGICAVSRGTGGARLARRIARSLGRGRRHRRFGWYHSELVLAVLADSRGQSEQAAQKYRALAEACPAFTYREAVRLRLGLILGGTEGQALQTEARLALRRDGVRNPDRFAAALIGHPRWRG